MRGLFLTLKTFSAVGGIEKVCKVAGKALNEICEENRGEFNLFSLYDDSENVDSRYIPASKFRGFRNGKLWFACAAVRLGVKADFAVLSHINLLWIGFLIKLLSPRTKVLLYAHGIEVWQPLPFWKRYILNQFFRIIAVSHYTKKKLMDLHHIRETSVQVLNNCLDPFLPEPYASKDTQLLHRLGLKGSDVIILTLSRLSHHDRDKGYEKVLLALVKLKPEFPSLQYVIAGKYQKEEREWLAGVIKQQGLEGSVVFTGYVPENELSGLFSIADAYVMPSTKEGFGIVLIEAMYYGKAVIAGNRDGSADALCHGELGILVDPGDVAEIANAVRKVITNQAAFVPDKKILLSRFSYPVYKANLKRVLQTYSVGVL